ncbi:tetratricopeptide repeat protein [Candidatus Nitrosotenuis uzonensis]|uniref:Putative Tetratricopeptide TPR_2 repeat protein n=1 Tax=Candidatus Nitrosotenuis uzonensis TaxID=1407055 RepID=A0A812F0T1_9ARCH|nr:tetratricopeptide repeat protein [Candidatus Nitrosotenuis uzonensis]CAE6489749.1 putative Tetratricopeptide TPR_2 repeat protein [Candidatus Nitrosotenuis uzonensis]
MDPRRGQLLPSILVLMPILFVTVPVFAEEIITLETDAEAYFTGDVMIISGHVPNWKMPIIAMSIFDPDGDILSANNVEIEDDGTFTRIVTLDSPFYDKTGIYLITVDYGKNSAFTVFEVFSDQTNNEPVLPPSKIIPEVTSLKADKNSYHTDEFIMITGTVSAIAEPTVLVGIYNPDGSPASFYTAQIDQNLNFSAKFLAKSGINFKTFGTYSVKAHYANTKLVTTFDFLETSMNADVPMQNDKASSNETVSNADKQVPENTPKTGTEPISNKDGKEITRIPSETKPTEHKSDVEIEDDFGNADNLTVHDEELGKMLNEITLNCDTSEFRDSLVYYDGMGPALMRLCKYEQAISYFDAALLITPNRAEIYSNKGSALAKLGQYSNAIAYYDAALEIDPKFIPALNNKANVLMHLGSVDDAISTYRKVLAIDPNYSVTLTNLERAQSKQSETIMVKAQIAEQIEEPVLIEYEPEPEMREQIVEKTEHGILEQIGSVFSTIGIIFGLVR